MAGRYPKRVRMGENAPVNLYWASRGRCVLPAASPFLFARIRVPPRDAFLLWQTGFNCAMAASSYSSQSTMSSRNSGMAFLSSHWPDRPRLVRQSREEAAARLFALQRLPLWRSRIAPRLRHPQTEASALGVDDDVTVGVNVEGNDTLDHDILRLEFRLKVGVALDCGPQ